MLDLHSYSSLEVASLVTWAIPNFDTAYVTDYTTSVTSGGTTWQNIGNLLGISNTVSELQSTPGEITISLSGVPTSAISNLFNQQIKGSNITVYHAFFNPTTHQALNVNGGSNILQKFKGIVTNYSISDSVDVTTELAVSTIVLTCNSIVEILAAKKNGRRTNPTDFPNESSMSRVQALSNSNFNFGAP
jgi:hypothetical protein